MGVILRVLLILSGVGILSMAAATPSANAQAAWGRAHGTSRGSQSYGDVESKVRAGIYRNAYTFLPLPVMVESQWDLFPGQPPSGPASPGPGFTPAPDSVGTVIGGPGQLIAGQAVDHVNHHNAYHPQVGLQTGQGQAPVSDQQAPVSDQQAPALNQVAANVIGSSRAELGRGAIESRPQPGLARSPGLSRTRPPVSGMDWSGFTGTRSADGSAPVSAFPAARFSEIIALFPRGEIGP